MGFEKVKKVAERQLRWKTKLEKTAIQKLLKLIFNNFSKIGPFFP